MMKDRRERIRHATAYLLPVLPSRGIFNRQHYFVLIDDTAEDRENYIMEQIFTAKSDARGVIFENPTSELTTYGLPFKGKDIYLFQQVSDSQRLDSLLTNS